MEVLKCPDVLNLIAQVGRLRGFTLKNVCETAAILGAVEGMALQVVRRRGNRMIHRRPIGGFMSFEIGVSMAGVG